MLFNYFELTINVSDKEGIQQFVAKYMTQN